MGFLLRFINLVVNLIAWLFVLGIVYAISPLIGKFLYLIQSVHNFGR